MDSKSTAIKIISVEERALKIHICKKNHNSGEGVHRKHTCKEDIWGGVQKAHL